MESVRYKFNTLEDFLISRSLTVDGELDDGWGAIFPIKGIELKATVLFADISGFTRATQDLSPTETLIFVNNFFSWISAEAIMHSNCIIDKYIGDEVMLVFSTQFGSTDPFVEALQTARWICERDVLSFRPHIGLASGKVTAGYVGTPLKYNASLFGRPVNLAARCAGIRPDNNFSSVITFPANEWQERKLDDVFPARTYKKPDGTVITQPHSWILNGPREVSVKNMGSIEVIEIGNQAAWLPGQSASDRARESMAVLKENGSYRGD